MYRTCSHIKTNGIICDSPALRDAAFCYHHYRWRKSHVPIKKQPVSAEKPTKSRALPFQFDDLDTPESIQIALSLVVRAIAQDTLDHNRGSAILYAIQMASANMSKLSYVDDGDYIEDLAPDPIAEETGSDHTA